MATEEANGPSTCEATDERFQQVEDYPWHSDPEFQSGLQSILGPDSPPDQAEELTLRAKCFYLSRKNNIPVDVNAYKEWRAQHASPSLPNGAPFTASEPPAPYPTSFNQIVELITNGQAIPGIKEVPETILEGQATQTATAKRKKPWEKDDRESGTEVPVAVIHAYRDARRSP